MTGKILIILCAIILKICCVVGKLLRPNEDQCVNANQTGKSPISVPVPVLGDVPCASRLQQDYESPLCVCNSTYCDQISKIVKHPQHYLIYTTSKSGLRFQKQQGKLTNYEATEDENTDIFAQVINFLNLKPKTDNIVFNVNRENMRQSIEGFGGAFSDSASINYKKLSEKTRENIIMSYFSENGIEYTLGRVPIAGTDFSIRSYTYSMEPENDPTLSGFSLVEEDYDYKIPFIKAAREATNNSLQLIAAAWSPPLWMKSSHSFVTPGEIIKEYYQAWADYQVKFLKEYEKQGIEYWAFSTGNEPTTGILGVRDLLSVGWHPHTQAKWIAENLGPTMKSEENFPNIRIITGDENRHAWRYWLPIMSLNQKAMSYVDGMSLHWYSNNYLSSYIHDLTHLLFKDVFFIATEACRGSLDENGQYVILGSWERAESYIVDIIDTLNHWFVGWVDWNLLLNSEGGPSWLNNFVDAPIIINEEKDEFVKQPMFYSMGHISKFIPRGSVKIDLDQVSGPNIDKTAFLRPDGGIAVVFYNGQDSGHNVTIKENGHGQMTFEIPPYSINSVVYW